MELMKPGLVNSAPLTPLNFLERTALIYGDCVSIVYNNSIYTWNDTLERCLRVASSLVSMGIERGHVVSVLAPNIPAMYELHFATPMAGAILNTINTRLDAHTVSVLLRHSESKLVFVDFQLTSLVLEALSLFPSSTERPTLVFISDEDHHSVPTVDFPCTYESLVEKGDPEFKWLRPKSEWDPIVLNYTSGTTSSPKGVVHYHRGIYQVVIETLVEWSLPKNTVYLWTLPMFHCNGWGFPWGIAAVGGTNVCLRKFDGNTIYGSISRYKVTHFCAAPIVLIMLIKSQEGRKLDLPVHILASGAPPPASVLSQTESLGFRVTHVYGMTELGGCAVWCTWKTRWNKLPEMERAKLKARQGVRTLTAAIDLDVVEHSTGMRVKRDGLTMGEIVVQGGCVMLGYLKDPEETSKCMRASGWFYTGDIGVMHPDGYLEIKDRSKDVIISGGENVSSVEVESVLYAHPMVNEAAVVARPDKFWGETPCAFVSLNMDKSMDQKIPTEEEIVEFCRARLPHFMAPKTVVFKQELPKTATGKIKKFVLREIAKTIGSSSSIINRL